MTYNNPLSSPTIARQTSIHTPRTPTNKSTIHSSQSHKSDKLRSPGNRSRSNTITTSTFIPTQPKVVIKHNNKILIAKHINSSSTFKNGHITIHRPNDHSNDVLLYPTLPASSHIKNSSRAYDSIEFIINIPNPAIKKVDRTTSVRTTNKTTNKSGTATTTSIPTTGLNYMPPTIQFSLFFHTITLFPNPPKVDTTIPVSMNINQSDDIEPPLLIASIPSSLPSQDLLQPGKLPHWSCSDFAVDPDVFISSKRKKKIGIT